MSKVATEPRERPILFNGEMVRAILDGRKTQTRRVVKPTWGGVITALNPDGMPIESGGGGMGFNPNWNRVRTDCPFGGPGGRLWVRERWRALTWRDDEPFEVQFHADNSRFECTADEFGDEYDQWVDRMAEQSCEDCAAAGLELDPYEGYTFDVEDAPTRWRPSIHMPRWASRITLELTGVRAERLQDISDQDARAEGVDWVNDGGSPYGIKGIAASWGATAKHAFSHRFDSINKSRGYGWDENPFVWVAEFKCKTNS